MDSGARFWVMGRMDGEEEFRELFPADDIEDARQIAIRCAMRPGYTICVYDNRLQERVKDFNDERYAR